MSTFSQVVLLTNSFAMKRPPNFIPAGTRKPVPIAAALESTFKSLHLKKKLSQYAAFPHWPEIVGEELAKVAYPERITRSKVLVVRVTDSVWAQELSFQIPAILERMRALNIGANIEQIRFVTGRPHEEIRRA